MEAGDTKSCSVNKAGYGLQMACMNSTFDVKCPAQNSAATTMPFLVPDASGEAPVRCQACGASASTDLNRKKGKYQVTLKWGRNVMGNEFSEDYIHGYDVVVVNENLTIVDEPMHNVSSRKFPDVACCKTSAYEAISIKGNWPDGAKYFMILPYQRNDAKDEKFRVPLGTTIKFIDIQDDKEQKKVTGTVTVSNMTEDQADKLYKNKDTPKVMQKSIAAAIGETEITADNIEVTLGKPTQANSSSTGSSRRLGGHLPSEKSWSVAVEYVITLPEGYTKAFTKDSIDTQKLAKEIETRAETELGIKGLKVSVKVSDPVITTVGTPADPTGAAFPLAGSCFSIALAFALAGRHFFA